jgi:hypothetical protein
MNDFFPKYSWYKLQLIISIRKANPREDQLLYNYTKLAGYISTVWG